jgi:hypothetical protein
MIEVTPALARSSCRIGCFTHSGSGRRARFGFFRQVEAVALDVGVGRVQQRQIVFVAAGEVLGQVGLEGHHAAVERLGQADQGHAAMGQPESRWCARHARR